MSKVKNEVQKHYEGEVLDYTDQYSDDYRGYPANKKRLEILRRRIKSVDARTLLDCGCGEGSPIARIHEDGVEVWGFDFVEEMIDQARRNLSSRGLEARVWHGSIMNPADFRPAGRNTPEQFDLTMAMGVFPHLTDEVGALRNMAAVTRSGGRVLCEFRNEAFAAYTLNRYSYEFMTDRLMKLSTVESKHADKAARVKELRAKLESFFRMDLPPIRKGTPANPGYDEILSRFHNPFEVTALFGQAGLRVERIHFYHFHAFPPMFEALDPHLFRELSLEMENSPEDWRGYFMASAYVVESVKE